VIVGAIVPNFKTVKMAMERDRAIFAIWTGLYSILLPEQAARKIHTSHR